MEEFLLDCNFAPLRLKLLSQDRNETAWQALTSWLIDIQRVVPSCVDRESKSTKCLSQTKIHLNGRPASQHSILLLRGIKTRPFILSVENIQFLMRDSTPSPALHSSRLTIVDVAARCGARHSSRTHQRRSRSQKPAGPGRPPAGA